MLVHILMPLEKVGDVKQSLPMLLVCYILLPCENQKLPDIAWQHCLAFHSGKGLGCQKVTGHKNLFSQNKTAVLHLAQITRIASLKVAFSASFREKHYSKHYTASEEEIIPLYSTPLVKRYLEKLLRA